MESCRVVLQPSVRKDLRNLPKKVAAQVVARIEGLAEDPSPRQSLKLSGADRLYRIRVGDYRIIHEYDPTAMLVTIYYVRHRREVYRAL
jgi:mRNA interferase RelE/StbE